MDAETTWNVWRCILKDDRLSQQVASGAGCGADLGLTAEEAAVVAAYAAHPKGSRWAIETYRYRLVSAALGALATGGQLTQRLLRSADVDLRRLAQTFVESRGRIDDGPFVYRTCSAFLGYIRTSDDLRHLPGLRDIAALDLAVTRLMTQCAELPGECWSTADERRLLPTDPRSGWYVQTGLGIVTTTERRLTPWLMNAELFGSSQPEVGTEHLLVYLPDLDHSYALCLIGDAAASLFRRVAPPCSYADLLNDLGVGGQQGDDGELGGDRLVEALASLAKLGVVRGVATRSEALAIAQVREPVLRSALAEPQSTA
jgi:hypothetical protein